MGSGLTGIVFHRSLVDVCRGRARRESGLHTRTHSVMRSLISGVGSRVCVDTSVRRGLLRLTSELSGAGNGGICNCLGPSMGTVISSVISRLSGSSEVGGLCSL